MTTNRRGSSQDRNVSNGRIELLQARRSMRAPPEHPASTAPRLADGFAALETRSVFLVLGFRPVARERADRDGATCEEPVCDKPPTYVRAQFYDYTLPKK
jgi:hypothetical protein